MLQSSKTNTLNKVLSLALCVFLAGSLIPFLPIEAYAAGEIPGTQAYYDARWEEAKVAAGYKNPGTSYIDHTGAAATTTNGGPWELNLDWGNTCSRPWDGTAVAPTTITNVTNTSGTAVSAYEVYTAEQFRWCVLNHQSFKLMKDIDLNGYAGKVWTRPAEATNPWVADGNGHTVSNYYGDRSLFFAASYIEIKSLRLTNGYMQNDIYHNSFFFSRW